MKGIKRVQLGKKGLTKEFVEQLKKYFENSEVIKIDILRSCCRDKEAAKKIGEELVEKLGENYTFRLIGYVLTVRRWRKLQR